MSRTYTYGEINIRGQLAFRGPELVLTDRGLGRTLLSLTSEVVIGRNMVVVIRLPDGRYTRYFLLQAYTTDSKEFSTMLQSLEYLLNLQFPLSNCKIIASGSYDVVLEGRNSTIYIGRTPIHSTRDGERGVCRVMPPLKEASPEFIQLILDDIKRIKHA